MLYTDTFSFSLEHAVPTSFLLGKIKEVVK